MDSDYIPLAEQLQAGIFDTLDLTFLIILLLLLLCSILISASEIAYASLSPSQLKSLEEKKNARLSRLLLKPESLLATLFAGSLLVNVGIALLSSYLLYPIVHGLAHPVVEFIAFVVVIAFTIILFSEIIPKIVADRYQIGVVRFMATPLLLISFLMRPVSHFLIRSTNLSQQGLAKKESISIEQISRVLEYTDESKMNEEKDILEGIVRFSNIAVVDIICPRGNISAININSSYKEVQEIVFDRGYSRLPVYEENLDHIRGILYVKDLLQHLAKGNRFNWQSLLRPAYHVPETKKIKDLLEEFQSKKVHLAIVVDEYGGTSGIVTIEDIIEEIVGDINDEYDEQEIFYTRDKNGNYLFEASTLLNDFFKITDVNGSAFENIEGEADTLAGLILEIHGEFPQKGDVITYAGHQFTILEMDNRRIKKIKYQRTGEQS